MADYNKYDSYTDEELIERLRDGEEAVMEYLIAKYKDLVLKKTRSMYILGADHDDLLQEGMLGLFKAIRDYDAGRDAAFSTFAELCVTRQVYTAIQAANRQKHSFLNYYVSLEAGMEEGNEQIRSLLESYTDGSVSSPETIVVGRDSMEAFLAEMERVLSPFERQVVELQITGMNYTEIAAVLNREAKAVDNAIQRIRNKIRQLREEFF